MTLYYLQLIKELLITDLILIRQRILGNVLNTLIWATSVTLISTYVFPLLGMNTHYGSMILIGIIVSTGVFETFGNASMMVSDLDGERTISYQLTLPLPGWMLMLQKTISYAIFSALLTLVILPMGKIIMGDRLLLSAINPGKFAIAFIATHLFCGTFSLILTAYTANMGLILNVWTRFLFPLWFFGGSQFDWYTLKKLSPWLAYINLANPLTFIYEAIKGASLPHGQYLPFWPCIGAVALFSGMFLYAAHRKMQKRLDYL